MAASRADKQPRPDIYVIEAIFDTYLSARKKSWSLLPTDNGFKLPTDPTARHKAFLVAELVSKAKTCQSIQDWEMYAKELYTNQLKEKRTPIGAVLRGEVLIAETLTAVRAYVLSIIVNAEYNAKLTTDANNNKHLTEDARFYDNFFKTIVMKHDHRNLNETGFYDYVRSVNLNSRKLSVLNLLLADPEVVSHLKTSIPAKQPELPAATAATPAVSASVTPAPTSVNHDDQPKPAMNYLNAAKSGQMPDLAGPAGNLSSASIFKKPVASNKSGASHHNLRSRTKGPGARLKLD